MSRPENLVDFRQKADRHLAGEVTAGLTMVNGWRALRQR